MNNDSARILIVDDEAVVRDSLAEWFRDEGYEVDTADCAKTALEKLVHANWDIFLLDIRMPGIDGLEVLRRIKSDPALRSIPVVMLTSSREENDLVESYRLGVNAYVVKPVEFSRFVQAVRELGVFWAVINEAPPGSVRKGP